MKKIIILALLLATLGVGCQSSSVSKPANGLKAYLSSDKKTYGIGESIKLRFSLENIGEKDITLNPIIGFVAEDEGRLIANLLEIIQLKENHIIITLNPFRVCAWTKEEHLTLQAGEAYSENLIFVSPSKEEAAKFFLKLENPGEYFISVKYNSDFPINIDDSLKHWRGTVASNTIKINIVK